MFVTNPCQVLFQKGPMEDPWAKNHYKPTPWEKAGSWLSLQFADAIDEANWAENNWKHPWRKRNPDQVVGDFIVFVIWKVASVVLKPFEYLGKLLRQYGEGKNPRYPIWEKYLQERDHILQNNTFIDDIDHLPKLPDTSDIWPRFPVFDPTNEKANVIAYLHMEKQFRQTLEKINFWDCNEEIAKRIKILRDENPSKEKAKQIFIEINQLETNILQSDTPDSSGLQGRLKTYFDDVNAEWKRIEKAVKPLRKYHDLMKNAYQPRN